MPLPSVTYTFVAGTSADAGEVNTNFTDVVNFCTDGTKDFTVNSLALTAGLTVGGNLTLSGNVVGALTPNADATYDIGTAALGWKHIYLDNTGTDGGTIYFDGGSSSYLQSSTDGATLSALGWTTVAIGDGSAADEALLINADSGDAKIDLQVNNAAANSWTLINDNSDSDKFKLQYNGSDRMRLEVDGTVGFVDTDLIILEPNNITGATQPTKDALYPNTITKAWAYTNSAGTLQDSVNLTVTKSATGTYAYTFRRNMTNTAYAVVVTCNWGGGATRHYVGMVNDSTRATTGFTVITMSDTAGTNVLADQAHSVIVIGEQ